MPTDSELFDALSGVVDPDLRRPIGELGLLREVSVGDSGLVTVGIS